MEKKIGLVTVLYNSDTVIENFFESLSKQTYTNYVLYIIDNSPSEKSDILLHKLYTQYPQVNCVYLRSVENYGVAKGNNIGIRCALNDGVDYVLLLNNDIEFYNKNLLLELVDCAVTKNEAFVIPKILFLNSRMIWMAGGAFDRLRVINHHFGGEQEDSVSFSKSGYVDYAPTCFMLINAEVFNTVGMMDENYFVYYDDADFVIRANRSGYRIYYMPTLEVFHNVSMSTGGINSPFTIYYANRNRIYFLKKHYSLFGLSPFYIMASVIRKLFYYKKDQRHALLKSIYDGIFMKISK